MSSFDDKNQFKRISFQPPNKIMNITCGKLIESKIFSMKQKEKREGKSTKLKRTNCHHQQQNKIDESFTFQMTRKLKCDYRQRNTSLYLYFLLLAIDPTAKVVLRRNLRDSKKQHTFKTYGCDSIESRNQCIYSKDFRYKLTYDEEHNSNTIDFDEFNECPLIDYESTIVYTREQNHRIQQHILIQVINKRLNEINEELKYYIRGNYKTQFLETIQFDEYFDMNEQFLLEEKSRLTKKQSTNGNYEKFEELCETIFKILTYFLDRGKGITKQLVIGYSSKLLNEYKIDNECSFIGRSKFFEVIHEVRNRKRNVEEMFLNVK